jgi:hypothetical protein
MRRQQTENMVFWMVIIWGRKLGCTIKIIPILPFANNAGNVVYPRVYKHNDSFSATIAVDINCE